jgi:hydrogenase maturation protein HypF
MGPETKVRPSRLSGQALELGPVFDDLGDFRTFRAYRRTILGWTDREPAALACDLHPDYLSSILASELAAEKHIPLVRVQHHFSHLVSVLFEHGLDEKVIGVVFDGTGYGDDGSIWGGEVFIADRRSCERRLHLQPVPMAGLDLAVREPWRMALAWLEQPGLRETDLPLGGFMERVGVDRIRPVRQMLGAGAGLIRTSSAGRLFDAVASLLGICDVNTKEAEAAIRLEQSADTSAAGVFKFGIDGAVIGLSGLISGLLEEAARSSPAVAAGMFHNTMAGIVHESCLKVSRETGLKTVCVSGGVFQNRLLNERLDRLFAGSGLTLLRNRELSPTDLNVSAGQAVHAQAIGWF